MRLNKEHSNSQGPDLELDNCFESYFILAGYQNYCGLKSSIFEKHAYGKFHSGFETCFFMCLSSLTILFVN